jgi:hypothetical protein
MIVDGHIHIMEKDCVRDDFPGRLRAAGIDGGIVFFTGPVDSKKSRRNR